MNYPLLLIGLESGTHLNGSSKFLFLIYLEVLIELNPQIDTVMNIILDENHPRYLDVDGEALQVEHS